MIDSGDGDDTNIGDNSEGTGDGGDDKIKSGKGNDRNCGDNVDSLGVCVTDGNGGDDKINAGQGDDLLAGGSGADKFQCGSGDDDVTDFNLEEGDKATGNCENVDKNKSKN